MFLNYIKFLGVTGVACSALLAEGGGFRAVKEAKAQRYRVSPDEHFDSTSTEPHQVDQKYMPIKGRALEYLADKSKSEPATVQASKVAKNYHLKPDELAINRLLHDANAAVSDSKEEAGNLSAAANLLNQKKQYKEAAVNYWKAAIVYSKLKKGEYAAARAFEKSAFIFENIKVFSNAIKGYQNAGKLYEAIKKYEEAGTAFTKAKSLHEMQKELYLANKVKLSAQKKYLDLKRRDSEISNNDRTELKNDYDAIGVIYQKHGIHEEAAKAFRNAGGFSLQLTERIQFYKFAEARYKEANMTAEEVRMVAAVNKLTLLEQNPSSPVMGQMVPKDEIPEEQRPALPVMGIVIE